MSLINPEVTVDKPERLTKKDALTRWVRIPKETPLPSHTMKQVPYKHRGSTYAEDGIRLTGSQQFIDSMLNLLRPLLERENATERLQLVYSESVDRETQRPTGSWNCYIQVHERGSEAKHFNQSYGAVTYSAVPVA